MDAEVLLALKKEQPQNLSRLRETARTSRASLYRILPHLIERQAVKEVENGYALSDYEPLEGALRKVLKKLQRWEWSEVTIDYLGGEAGQFPDEEFKRLAWRLVGEYNMKIGDKIRIKEQLPSDPYDFCHARARKG